MLSFKLPTANASTMSRYSCEVLERPGLEWPPEQKIALIHDLRALATQCFPSLPEYQCLSLTYPNALDDKLIAVARRDGTGEVIGFSSAVFFNVPHVGDVLHTGLTCIHPSERRSGLTIGLFANIFGHLLSMFPDGIWLTNLAAIPSSLVSIYQVSSNVFPSPEVTTPSSTHLAIANVISTSHRHTMSISPEAPFDSASFVFRDSNPLGSPFRKDVTDPALQHRNLAINDFYRNLLIDGIGDEVLQVAFLDSNRVTETIAARYVELAENRTRAKL